jgi:hypothetical protein
MNEHAVRSVETDVLRIAYVEHGPSDGTKCAHRESKTAMRPVSDNALAFSHVSFESLRVQGPSEQIFMGLCILSLRSVLSTSAKIEPLKGEYR